MWEKAMLVYQNLLAIGFDVRVAIISLGVYFTARQIIEYIRRNDKDIGAVKQQSKIVALVPTLILNFVGQMAFSFPKEAADWWDTAIWTIGQTVGAMGFYSLAETTHLIDKVSDLIKVKFGGDANANPPAV